MSRVEIVSYKKLKQLLLTFLLVSAVFVFLLMSWVLNVFFRPNGTKRHKKAMRQILVKHLVATLLKFQLLKFHHTKFYSLAFLAKLFR